MGSNPIWGSDFFCVLLWLILYISPYFPLYINITGIIILTLEIMWYRVWKGTCIFGIRDLTKIQWEWKNAKYLDQKQNLTAMQEVGFTKILFGHGMWEFFASLSGIWELRKWAGKYRERGRRNPLHSPSSFLPLFPLCFNIVRYQEGCLIFDKG